MDRVAIPVRTPDGCPGSLDQFTGKCFAAKNRAGDSSLGSCRTQSILPRPEGSANKQQACKENEETLAVEEVVSQQIWLQLSASEQQRFGHCFSFMVLKALGLRSDQSREVEV